MRGKTSAFFSLEIPERMITMYFRRVSPESWESQKSVGVDTLGICLSFLEYLWYTIEGDFFKAKSEFCPFHSS